MQKVDLKKVLEMLINEEQDSAEGLLHQWFVEKTRSIHENLMQEEDDILEDDNLTKDIEDDQDEIESEEYFGEADLDGSGDEDEVDDAANTQAVGDVDSGETSDVDDTEDHQIYGDADDMSTNPEDIQNQFADLQSDLARLKAEFTKLTSGDNQAGADTTADASSDDAGSNLSPAGEMGNESFDYDDLGESKMSNKERMAKVRSGQKTSKKDDDDDKGSKSGKDFMAKVRAGKKVKEDIDDFDDLDESFMLEPVTPAGMKTPTYSGTGGGKIEINNKSPIPQNKPDDRVGGRAIEIRAQEYTGTERQEAPKVKQGPLRKNQIKSMADGLESVGSTGPKNALLNREKEIYPDTKNEKSLMGSQGTDLRGNFMKRK